MPGPWGPPLMMYPPCPPWEGWYGPWALPLTHFPPGWLEPMEGLATEATRQEMTTAGALATSRAGEPETGKPDALISPKTAATPRQQPGSDRAEE
jgi:hypothetical protein